LAGGAACAGVAAAKRDLTAVNQTWTEASEAYNDGNFTEANVVGERRITEHDHRRRGGLLMAIVGIIRQTLRGPTASAVMPIRG
jgi:hypothetical protein